MAIGDVIQHSPKFFNNPLLRFPVKIEGCLFLLFPWIFTQTDLQGKTTNHKFIIELFSALDMSTVLIHMNIQKVVTCQNPIMA